MEEKSWKEFRQTGLFWWINTLLHTFGWALVAEIKDGEVVRVYPARVGFRGFSEKVNTDGYEKVALYLADNAEKLLKEIE